MDAKIWLEYFKKELEEIEENKNLTDGGWTKILGNILGNIGEKTKCYVAQKRSRESKDEHSGEYLNIDAMFLDDSYNKLVKDKNEYDPFVLPRVIVELENDPDKDKIAYSLWKLLCIRASLRVLICYGKGEDIINELVAFLENVIETGVLMK